MSVEGTAHSSACCTVCVCRTGSTDTPPSQRWFEAPRCRCDRRRVPFCSPPSVSILHLAGRRHFRWSDYPLHMMTKIVVLVHPVLLLSETDRAHSQPECDDCEGDSRECQWCTSCNRCRVLMPPRGTMSLSWTSLPHSRRGVSTMILDKLAAVGPSLMADVAPALSPRRWAARADHLPAHRNRRTVHVLGHPRSRDPSVRSQASSLRLDELIVVGKRWDDARKR